MKPGYKTTEFWVAVIVAFANFVAAWADALPDRYAAIASSIVGGLYAISRGLAKVYPPKPGV
jgi:hypothetical protein